MNQLGWTLATMLAAGLLVLLRSVQQEAEGSRRPDVSLREGWERPGIRACVPLLPVYPALPAFSCASLLPEWPTHHFGGQPLAAALHLELGADFCGGGRQVCGADGQAE